jgi:hypothetical protein
MTGKYDDWCSSFLWVTDRNRIVSEISVYEVYPSSPCPEFNLVARLSNVNVAVTCYASTQSLLAFYHAHGCSVWNFVLDSVVTWAMRGENVLMFFVFTSIHI